MDRRSLLALFSRRPHAATLAPGNRRAPLSPEAVYEVARDIRDRIDDALAASLQDPAARKRR